jgi:tRNA (adenine-N(1)-)-methyltransferase non-catalytic subunit
MSGDDTLFVAIQTSSKAASHRPHDNADGLIHAGDTILLRLPTGDIKSNKLEADSCVHSEPFPSQDNLTLDRIINLGKFGSFLADALVGQPYGLTYEIVNKTISVIPPPAVEELGKRIFLHPGAVQ